MNIDNRLASEIYLQRKRHIPPMDYAPKKRSLIDDVVDMKKEKLERLRNSNTLLRKDLEKHVTIDLTQDDVIMVDIDDDETDDTKDRTFSSSKNAHGGYWLQLYQSVCHIIFDECKKNSNSNIECSHDNNNAIIIWYR